MKKAIYSITKLGKQGNSKVTGLGYVAGDELITAQVSSTNKPYVRIYDCINHCSQVQGTEDEYKGLHTEYVEYEGKTIEVNYLIWYKMVKE